MIERLLATRKEGWSLFGRWFLFTVDVGLLLIPPILVAEFFLNSHEMAVFDNDGFHWQPCVSIAVAVIFLPIAFSFAQRQTGLFREDKNTEQPNPCD